MRGWQIAFLLSCAVHFALFNLPDFSGEVLPEKRMRRTPITLRVMEWPPSQKKPSTRKITQKPKERSRNTFQKKIKKVKKQKKLVKPRPPRPKQVKQKKIPAPSIIEPVSRATPVSEPVLPPPKQLEVHEVLPTIKAATSPPKQAHAPKMVIVEPVKSGVFKDLKITHRLVPDYPLAARREGREGIVQIKIQILESGDLGNVQLYRTSGFRDLDHAALKAIQSWRFEPARRNGIPVRQSAIFPVAFVLD